MSFITFDFQCQDCGKVEERMVRRSEVYAQMCDCAAEEAFKEAVPMKQLPAGPITTFKFGDRSAIKSRKAVSLRDPH